MNASALPYHLRPHKAVDRRLFVDLLARYERWKPISNYVYASMGSYPLEDHRIIHRALGISRLLAFDYEDSVVARQKFNKPVDRCVCLHLSSDTFISKIEDILLRDEFAGFSGVAIWLDYTSPRDIGKQIREFQALLSKAAPGDILRVTVNAHAGSYRDEDEKGPNPLKKNEAARKQYERLQGWIGDFFPNEATFEDVNHDKLPALLARSFSHASEMALPATGDNTFTPLSIVRYADGQQMLSITGVVVERGRSNEMLGKVAIAEWPFYSSCWTHIHKLVVPALTLRERLFLERGILDKTDEEIIDELGFSSAAGMNMRDFLSNYRNYYRFYPTLLNADI